MCVYVCVCVCVCVYVFQRPRVTTCVIAYSVFICICVFFCVVHNSVCSDGVWCVGVCGWGSVYSDGVGYCGWVSVRARLVSVSVSLSTNLCRLTNLVLFRRSQ
eukprot:GHVR01094824.1.p2 GENE.GHVR01094824.1~~GHVR01094824.1.p2  ORF type:complete len:103 (+),score=42.04 GHVR01094824.1:90-398(+)